MSDSDEYDFASKFKKAQAKIQSTLYLDLSLDGPDLIPHNLDTVIQNEQDKLDLVIRDEVDLISNKLNSVSQDTIVIVDDNEVIELEDDTINIPENSRVTRSKAKCEFNNRRQNTRNIGETETRRQKRKGLKRNEHSQSKGPVYMVSSDSDSEAIICQLDKSQEQAEDLNYEQTVLIKWIFVKSYRIPLRRFQKLTAIQEELAKHVNVVPQNIKLMLNDRELDVNECLHSLNITAKDVIDAIPASDQMQVSAKHEFSFEEPMLKFKIQIKNVKKPLFTQIKHSDKLHVLFLRVSEELNNIPISKMKFKFDGDLLMPDKTAAEQDLEGGECIDLEIIEKYLFPKYYE